MSTYRAKAPMHKNRNTTINRVGGFINRDNLFRDINLPAKVYGESRSINDGLTYWSLPGGSGAWKQWNFAEIIQQDFQPVPSGHRFGPTWTTHWFKAVITVPDEWRGQEVHLRWGTGCESTIYNEDGHVLQGISPGYREEYIISRNWSGSGPITFYIEMACNEMFGAGNGDLIAPTNPDRYFQIVFAEIRIFNRPIFKVLTDLEVLHGIAWHLPNEHIGYQALFAANEMVTLIKRGNVEEASQIADGFFAEKNGEKAHQVISMGHCHIDTAWLWPYDETIRKCARSWSAQIRLMDEYPDFVFACSSAQQYAWVEEYYPSLFNEIKLRVASGKFAPVGGVWLEMDGNLPSGEGFVRQFFYGQRFFQRAFGFLTKEFWLPDTFGYAAQIPQIMKHVGVTRFITQKMSWSIVNKFPNHNFWWEGIDGTEVLVHFPPGNSYNMQGNVDEVLFTRNNSEDKGRANVGVFLFGNGDGGGGPTRQMIEKQIRMGDVDGIPKVKFGTPEEFWTELERESSKLYKWVGELYLELHNGTYTSQAKIKWYNRKIDIFFREIELLFSIAYVTGKVTQAKMTADMAQLDVHWKNYLLNQFHDVLPGSCIELATQDAWRIYAEIFTALTNFRNEYHGIILGTGSARYIYNALNWSFRTVIFQRPNDGVSPIGENIQSVILRSEEIEESTEGSYRVPSSFSASLVQMNASGYTQFQQGLAPTNPVQYTSTGGVGTFSNGFVRLTFPLEGMPIENMFFKGPSEREKAVYNDRLKTETIPAMLYIYDDVPMYWDAWDVMDYHLETRELPNFTAQTNATNFATGPIVGGYRWTGTFGDGSTFERYSIIRADSPMVEYYLIIDWKEDRKFLKVEFPVDVLARDATFEIQYGHAKRPTHINTSWDMAKFEVCGHKWMDISQGDKGVTFITDSKYGWHVRDNIVKLSMLKSPKNPDDKCDMHKHFIYYAVLPHEGPFQEAEVIQRAYELNFYGANNVPWLRGLPTPTPPANFVTVSNPAVIIEAFKPAHDVPGSVIVRLYESFGGNAEATTINLAFTVTSVHECDGLERRGEPVQHANNAFITNFTPFQLRTFIIAFQ